MQKGVVVLGMVAVVALGGLALAYSGARLSTTRPLSSTAPSGLAVRQLIIGAAVLTVELAEKPSEWERGLSRRAALPEDAGMLFLFPEAAPKTFWMKDTLIPLDIIWIRESRVVGITGGVQLESGTPDAQLHRYRSPGLVDQVLEVNAGWAKRNVIRVGDHAGLVPK